MPFSNKITGYLAAFGMLLLTAFASSSAYAGVLIPGILDPGVPSFLHTVKLQVTPSGNMTAKLNNGNRTFTFNDGSTIWSGDGTRYRLDAKFNKTTGALKSGGEITIEGTIPGLVDVDSVLFTADLTSFDTNGGSLIGFNMTNLFCNPMLGVSCGTDESVIFSLDSLFLGTSTGAKYGATAITTVPLPAAVWLFGSGLALIGGVTRRRKSRQVS